MAKVNFNNAMQAQVVSDAATTVEEIGALLSSYVDLMLDVALNTCGGEKEAKLFALLVAAQTQVGRLTTIPDVLIAASASATQPETA